MLQTPLNNRQSEAADTLAGPILILAGAGTGKTRVIVERIANLIKSGVAPEEILAITFTNKAAREMRERVIAKLRDLPEVNFPVSHQTSPIVETFHALAERIIRENAEELGLTKHFAIFDRSDSKAVIKDALRGLDFDPKQFDSSKILSAISRSKGEMVGPDDYEEKNGQSFFNKVVASVWRQYDIQLKKEKALDFDDLLSVCARLLSHPDIKARYQERFKYVHVDEYQDTNHAQFQIANFLAEKHRNICVVGDIDQNIYSWRGARLRNILDFEKDYPEAKIILLEENYRSTKTILDVANLIIEKNQFRKKKKLFTQNQTGEKISIFEPLDEMEEAEFVATKAKELIASGAEDNQIAVLYRANFQSRVLEEAFLSLSVPYQVLGTRFYERKEVKDVISYIKVAINAESLTDLKRVLNVPPRGIGKISILKILSGQAGSLSLKAKNGFAELEKILGEIREMIGKDKVSEIVKFIIKRAGIESELLKDEDSDRIENVRELVTLASRYNHIPSEEGIDQFLTDVSLLSDQDELDRPKNGVKLMTVHAAKGLEFDFVFISGLEEGLFPHRRHDEDFITEEEAEEERRLCYVALTRARKKLYLSYAQTRTLFGTKSINIPSEFILEIPDSFLERESGNYRTIRKPLLTIEF